MVGKGPKIRRFRFVSSTRSMTLTQVPVCEPELFAKNIQLVWAQNNLCLLVINFYSPPLISVNTLEQGNL